MGIAEIMLYVISAIVILFLLLKCLSAIFDVLTEILKFFIWIAEHIQKIFTWFKMQLYKIRASIAKNKKDNTNLKLRFTGERTKTANEGIAQK